MAAEKVGLGVDVGSLGCRFAIVVNGEPVPIWTPRQFDEFIFDAANTRSADPVGESLRWRELLGEAGELSTMGQFARGLLAHGIHAAETGFQAHIKQLVLSVPATFSARHRQILQKCAAAAGASHIYLVSDSVALVASRTQTAAEETVLVYQCGYTGFEVAVVSVLNDRIHVLSYAGSDSLSGRRLDRELVTRLATRAFLPEESQQFMVRSERSSRATAANLREQLTRFDEVNVDFCLPDAAPVTASFSMRDWHQWMRPMVERTLGDINRALSEARIRVADITEIVLGGGSTANPVFREVISEHLGKPVRRLHDWSAAFGAAQLATRLDTVAPGAASPTLHVAAGNLADDGHGAQPSSRRSHLTIRLELPPRAVEHNATDAHADPALTFAAPPANKPQSGRVDGPVAGAAALRALEKAERLLEHNRLAEAVTMSHQAYAYDRESADVLSSMQAIHRRAAEAMSTPEGYEKSINWLLCANGHDPTNMEIRRALADRHLLHARQTLQQHKAEDAVKAAEAAFQLRPESDEIESVLDEARNAAAESAS
jgi:actin-like ATPase involved in cell morphogenesis